MLGSGVRVRTLSMFYEEWLEKLPVSELQRVSLLFDIGELHRRGYGRTKRFGDVCGAIVMSLFVTVLLPVVVTCNLVGNRGPLFFRQERVGQNGRVFALYKFRTMGPETERQTWTTHGDRRITAFGRLMRSSHLDELPQVVNILRGDLSFIGPRPEQPRYVETLVTEIPFYEVRHLVRPGLTGWAQVKLPYGASVANAREKLQYDFFYLRHQGFLLDLRIVIRTIRSVLLGKGR